MELLERLRRELLSWLPLGRAKAFGRVVVVVVAAPRVAVAEKKSFTEEREKKCNHHVRWFGGYLRWG